MDAKQLARWLQIWKAQIDARLKELRADDEYSAWSLTRAERGFHDPERFWYLQFLDLR